MLRRALRAVVVRGFDDDDLEGTRERALRWYNNLAKCSCYMCGNPRKYYGELPYQERRLLEAARIDTEAG